MILQTFPVRMGALPGGIVAYAAYMDAEPSDAAEAAELADWLFGRQQFPKLDGVDTELLGCEVQACHLKSRATLHSVGNKQEASSMPVG